MSEKRELEILCKGILDVDLEKGYNSQDGYWINCHLCRNCVSNVKFDDYKSVTMDNFKYHHKDCPYLIARDLLTDEED